MFRVTFTFTDGTKHVTTAQNRYQVYGLEKEIRATDARKISKIILKKVVDVQK